jgi:hypothetical protein
VLNLWTEKFTCLLLYFRSAQQSHFRDGGQAGQQEARQKGKSTFYVLSHIVIVTVLVKATILVLWIRNDIIFSDPDPTFYIVPDPDPFLRILHEFFPNIFT